MSKLKRKRVTVVEESKPHPKSEIRDQPDRLRNPGGTSSSRSCSSAGSGPWWTAADLTAVEKVWVLTLQAFCPAAFSSPASTSCVPELPQTPARAERERPSEWRWCRLDEDVTELPALKDSRGCVPIHSVPPCTPNDGSLQPEASPAEQLSERVHEHQASTSQRHLEDNQKKCPTLREWSEKPDSFGGGENQRDGSRSMKRSQKSGGGKSGRKIRPGNRGDVQTPGYHGDRADHRKVTHLQGEKRTGAESEGRFGTGLERESKSTAVVSGVSSLASDADCRPGTSRGGSGAGAAEAKLECCPMCLMPFPAGFSQMDCDAHLAQCLSEMNMDVVW